MQFLIDVETYSTCDLEAAGGYAYAQHPTTDLLCVSWICTDLQASTATVHSWVPGDPPGVFVPGDRLSAWGDFDRLIYQNILVPKYGWPAMPNDRWDDLMIRAFYGNLPGRLSSAAKALATQEQKDNEGHLLMMRLSRPARPILSDKNGKRHHTPEALAALAEYCRQDVRAEADVGRLLPKMPASEEDARRVDRVINDRGVQIDTALVDAIYNVAAEYADHLRSEMERTTGGKVKKETQLTAMTNWLRGEGVVVAEGQGAMNKDAVLEHLKVLDPASPAHRVLSIRRELAKSSLAKLDRLKAATNADGRMRGMFQFYGAHQTGRWAGRIVQPQNLPKGVLDSEHMETYHLALDAVRSQDIPYIEALYGATTMDVLASLIRCCFIPKAGHVFATADWNAIEPRVAAWMSKAKHLLAIFAAGTDPYKAAAAMAYSIKLEEVTKKQRNSVGKPQIIGCGYGMGANKLSATFGIDLDLSQLCVDTFRNKLAPEVPYMWRAIENAAKLAVAQRGTVFTASVLAFKADARHLYMRLPSGRVLWYREVNMQPGKFGPEIHFMSEDGMSHYWSDTHTWGGTLTENADQAISSCLLRDTLIRSETAGLNPVMHVHDEVICEVPEATASNAERRLVEIMETPPSWAAGLPIAAKPDLRTFYVK